MKEQRIPTPRTSDVDASRKWSEKGATGKGPCSEKFVVGDYLKRRYHPYDAVAKITAQDGEMFILQWPSGKTEALTAEDLLEHYNRIGSGDPKLDWGGKAKAIHEFNRAIQAVAPVLDEEAPTLKAEATYPAFSTSPEARKLNLDLCDSILARISHVSGLKEETREKDPTGEENQCLSSTT